MNSPVLHNVGYIVKDKGILQGVGIAQDAEQKNYDKRVNGETFAVWQVGLI